MKNYISSYILIALLLSLSNTLAQEHPCVAAILTLSGNFADLGEDCRSGIVAASKQHKSLPFELVYEDSKGEAKTAISALRKIHESNKCIAAITMRAPMGMAMNAVSKQLQIPLLGAVAHPRFTTENEFAYRMWAGTADEANVLYQDMLRRGLKKIATITAEDDWNLSLEQDLAKIIQASAHTKLIAQEHLTADTTDLQSIMLRVKQSSPDAIFINAGIAQSGLLARRAQEMGIHAQLYSTFWISKPEALRTAGDKASEGILFAETSTNLPKLKQLFSETVGKETISAMSLSCFSATQMLIDAFSADNKAITKQEVQAALLKQKSIFMPDSELVVEERKVLFPLSLKQIQSGKVVELLN